MSLAITISGRPAGLDLTLGPSPKEREVEAVSDAKKTGIILGNEKVSVPGVFVFGIPAIITFGVPAMCTFKLVGFMVGLPAGIEIGFPAGMDIGFAKLSGFCQMPLVSITFKAFEF